VIAAATPARFSHAAASVSAAATARPAYSHIWKARYSAFGVRASPWYASAMIPNAAATRNTR
jgi:hypothetical protein